MKRLLYLSQLAPADHPLRVGLPDERAMVHAVFGALGAEVRFVDVTQEPLPDLRVHGVVISGSLGSAHDREPWRVGLRRWLEGSPERDPARDPREAEIAGSVPRGTSDPRPAREAPRLGLCGGHQLLALARGGRVGPAVRPQVGVFPLRWEGALRPVVQLHAEAVLVPPLDAVVCAHDAWGIQALRYPGGTLTVQFHPELSAEMARALAGALGGSAVLEGLEEATARGKNLIAEWISSL